MLRALVAGLLLANLGVLAWHQGWWPVSAWLPAPPGAQREAHRLERQVRPQAVQLVAPAEAARLMAVQCLQAGPFGGEAWTAAEAAVTRQGLPADAWVRVPDPDDAQRAWLRVPQADAAMQAQLRGGTDAALGSGFSNCP